MKNNQKERGELNKHKKGKKSMSNNVIAEVVVDS